MHANHGTSFHESDAEPTASALWFEAAELSRKADVEAGWIEALKFADEDQRLIEAHEANVRHHRRMAMWFSAAAGELENKERAA